MRCRGRCRDTPRSVLRTMGWIFCICLITQVPHSAAAMCFPGEYEINDECCPMCSPGSRVLTHCKPNVSTTCIPCVSDTYTEHPNGLTKCMRCKVCDAGARLIVKEKCTYTKNTVCGCAPEDFCSHNGDGECEACTPSTICPPGSKVKKLGTEFRDNECEDCSDGTFSATNMSHFCQPWTKCEERGMREVKPGMLTSDAVCEQRGLSPAVVAVIVLVIFIVCAVFGAMYFVWRKRKRKACKPVAQKEEATPVIQAEGEPMQNTVTWTDALPIQETNKDHGKSSVNSS
ncbi:tumor necrosis factor receptor superfamily member 14 [Carettochelys insculpta]|uniref:tumor necrosis factor receptor superfamily member 14 n=1 Tax=Carettochelys insculpta TaxID=44489 RepID=UPI003EBE0273